MTDGDMTMFESGAMVDYILERYGGGRLRPESGTPESAIHHQWCWFSEATLSRPLGLNRILRASPDDVSRLIADGEQKARTSLEVVDQAVSDRDFLLGSEFGAADIMMGYTLELIRHLEVLDDHYPNASAYLERLKTRDACKRAMSA